MRLRLAFAVLLLASCTKKSLIPCTEQATCDPYGAVCLDGYCHHPGEEGLDLSAAADMAVPVCVDNTLCAGTTPICEVAAHACRACAIGECPAEAPRCLPSGACVECTTVGDCVAKGQVCDAPTHACRDCYSHTECASGVCDAGKCAADGDVVYVDDEAVLGAACFMQDGTKLKPYCDITSAVNGDKPYVIVAGRSTTYAGFTIPSSRSAPLYILGPQARIAPNADNVVVELDPAAALPKLTLDGFELTGKPLQMPAGTTYPLVGIGVTGPVATEVTLRNCFLHDGTSYGVDAWAASLVVEDSIINTCGSFAIYSAAANSRISRNLVSGNMFGVAVLNAYLVENNVIVDGIDGPAIMFGANASGMFRFNTVVNNRHPGNGFPPSAGGAANESTAVQTIVGSIFVGNTPLKGGSQLSEGPFMLVDTVTSGDTAPGAIQMPPNFVSTSDFHLIKGDATNSACCVDRLSTGPADDKDHTLRPLGAGFDVGAYEVQ